MAAPTREAIQTSLKEWLRNTGTTVSSLARDLETYPNQLYRIVRGDSCPRDLQLRVFHFVRDNPQGIPKRKYNRKTPQQRAAHKKSGDEDLGLPAPALHKIKSPTDRQWVHDQALQRHISIAEVLAEACALGIKSLREQGKAATK